MVVEIRHFTLKPRKDLRNWLRCNLDHRGGPRSVPTRPCIILIGSLRGGGNGHHQAGAWNRDAPPVFGQTLLPLGNRASSKKSYTVQKFNSGLPPKPKKERPPVTLRGSRPLSKELVRGPRRANPAQLS